MIIGIDEVGRGSWAGPLCVVAVAWPDDAPNEGLADSKRLSAARRQQMAVQIRLYAAAIGIGWVGPQEIDRIGLSKALQKAARLAVMQLRVSAPIIVDGRDKLLGDIPATYIIKADASVPAVMAASIIAKVARDGYMYQLDHLFGGYGFAKHVGYGTALHRQAIAALGPCVHHRLSYAPLRAYAS